MKNNFEYAYFQYLNHFPYKELMIDCGIKAIENNYYDDCVCQLAGAEAEKEQEILKLFISTAKVIRVEIPDPEQEKLWLSIKRKEFVKSLDFEDEFHDNMIIIHSYFTKSRNKEVQNFEKVFKQYIDININQHYDDWMDDLEEAGKKVPETSVFFEAIQLTTELIFDYSYGAILKHHYTETVKIMKLLEQVHKLDLI